MARFDPKTHIPQLRLHKQSGKAVVLLSGRQHTCGRWGSPESIAEYNRLLAAWLAGGRKPLDAVPETPVDPLLRLTVAEVLDAYDRHARSYYIDSDGNPTAEARRIRGEVTTLRERYGSTPAHQFGPKALKDVREAMIAKQWARRTVNGAVNSIRRIWRWAVSEEMLPGAAAHALEAVENLRRGRSRVRETEPVRPVSDADVEKTLPHLSPTLSDMIRLQRLTAMRPGEVCRMRIAEIDRSGSQWVYRPAEHKTAYLGRKRAIAIGPKARAIIEARIANRIDPDGYIFRPADGATEGRERRRAKRKTKLSYGNRAGTNNRGVQTFAPHYDRATYTRAVARACELAGVPTWSPNQLRHSAATEIARKYGIDRAAVVLGHSHPDVTAIYAERDIRDAMSIAAEVG